MKLKLTWLLTLFMAFVMQLSFGQDRDITGTVTAASDGLPLPSVTVVVKGTTVGASTNIDGKYTIKAKTGDVLVFSFVSMKTTEITVGNSNVVDASLAEDVAALEEVVVVAYGSQQKEKIVQNVAVINEEALENLVVTSPDQLLQGQASGVNITNTSGLLGSNVNVQIRGVGTINAGSQPLFVVDGVVLTDNQNTFGDGGNVGQNPFSFINPSDIENITVLKDAGATALYGTRGANGVILITTKKGKRGGGSTVSVNNFVQFTEINDLPTVLTPDEYRGFRTDVFNIQNPQFGGTVVPEQLGLGAIGSGGTDFVDEISRTGFTQHVDISLRGGTENTSYFVSGLYEDAESFAIGNDLTRFAFRANVENQAKDWLKIGANIGVTNTVLNAIGRENNTFAPFTSALLLDPTSVFRDENGNFTRSPSFIPNIIAVAELNTNVTDATRIIGSAYGQVNFTPNLYFRSEFGVDRTLSEQRTRNVDIVTAGGSANFLVVTDNLYRVTNSLNYTNTFGGKHTLSVLALQEFEERRRRLTQVAGTGFLTDDVTNVGAATTQTVSAATRSGSIITGYLGRVTYDYEGKYLFEATGRIDGSSRFGSGDRYGEFWSVAAGWTLSKEKFLENVDWLSFLSLRGSLGTAGNDRIGNFPSLALFGTGQFAGLPTAQVIQAESANLGFEETETLDIGFRSSFFNNRLNFNVSYFNRETSNLLFNVQTPVQTGAGGIATNAGVLENRGWEFDLSGTIVSNKDFQWNASLNLTTLDNEVVSIPTVSDIDAEGRRFIQTGAQRAIEGLPLSNFFLVRFNGINSQTGDAEWLDVDGNVTTTPNFDTDRVVIDDASALPDFTGGFTNNFKYKNWDLSTVFNFSVGNSILVDGLRFIDGFDAIGGTINVRRENLDFWRNPGDNAFLPNPASPTANNFNQRSTAQLRDGDYLRLKNITLGYSFPESLLEKAKIFSAVRVYATATNLWTIKGDDLDGIDPENNDTNNPLGLGESFFTAPQSISYLFGINIQF